MKQHSGADLQNLGFPASEYIIYNLQSLANYAQKNGGKFRVPFGKPLPGLPLVSMVVHVYDGYIEARLVPEGEFRAEKAIEKGLSGKPVGESE